MIQRDYILRLIEQLGVLIRALLGSEVNDKTDLLEIFEPAQVDEALEQSCQEAIGLSFRTIKEMAPEEVVQLFQSGGASWTGRCFFVGRLFEFDAEIAVRTGETERSEKSAQRALYFYNLLRENPEVPEEYRINERFEAVTELLRGRRS